MSGKGVASGELRSEVPDAADGTEREQAGPTASALVWERRVHCTGPFPV